MPSTAPDTEIESIRVAVAVIVNHDKQVLVSLRPHHVHQGGLWEFPGGKVEQNETVEAALKREIKEELDIEIESASPLIRIHHDYSDKSVVLDVWRVSAFKGKPHGMEGQKIRWCEIGQLNPVDFPRANQAIINVLRLPDRLLITGEFSDIEEFARKLEHSLSSGISMVQLRTARPTTEYITLAQRASKICKQYKAKLLLNTAVDIYRQLDADGLHLTSRRLFEHTQRPVEADKILSVSCHNEQEVHQANILNADMILLSPVRPTSSHPGLPGMGWQNFERLAAIADCPVYALGGMLLDDMTDAMHYGAHGIAAISCFWSHE